MKTAEQHNFPQVGVVKVREGEHNVFPNGRYSLPEEISGGSAAIGTECAAGPEAAAPALEPGGRGGPVPMPKLLMPGEAEELAFCVAEVKRGLVQTISSMEALKAIRDKRLYRMTHDTFESFCADEFGTSVRQVYRLLDAQRVMRVLSPASNGTQFALPATESQVRPLVGLPEADQLAVWSEAVLTAPPGKVTAKLVAALVRKRKGLPEFAQGPGARVQSLKPGLVFDAQPAGRREDRLRAAVDRAIADLREVLAMAGTPDSAKAGDLNLALEQVQNFADHLKSMEKLQASRV